MLQSPSTLDSPGTSPVREGFWEFSGKESTAAPPPLARGKREKRGKEEAEDDRRGKSKVGRAVLEDRGKGEGTLSTSQA